ncbi:hypothetical protein BSKO_04228 [Bryopsis sp. KO-2023]|nr:hypothetical protein BSKO_04228 [Bryopsis sp. KO-2023]
MSGLPHRGISVGGTPKRCFIPRPPVAIQPRQKLPPPKRGLKIRIGGCEAGGENVAAAAALDCKTSVVGGVVHGRTISNFNVLLGYMGASVMTFVMGPVLGAMTADAALEIGSASVGNILACGNFGGVVGKAASAQFVLSMTPKRSLVFVLAGSAVANSLFSKGSCFLWFAALWTVARFFLATAWVSTSQLMRQLHPPEKQGAALGSAALVSRAGSILVTIMAGYLCVNGFGWRTVIISAATFGTIGASVVAYFVTIPAQENESSSGGGGGGALSGPVSASPNSFMGFLRDFSKVRLMLGNRCVLQAVMEIQMFIAFFGQSFQGLSITKASGLLVCFSSGAAISVFLSGHLYVHLNRHRRRQFMVTSCIANSLCLLLLSATSSPLQSSILFVILGMSIAPPFYIAVPEFNARFAGKKSAILEGGSEMLTMIVALVIDCVIGFWISVAGPSGWPSVFRCLSGLMVFEAILLGIFLTGEVRPIKDA